MFRTKVAGKIKTHVLCPITVLVQNEIMQKNMQKSGRIQMAI
jgi:hypothetical protein